MIKEVLHLQRRVWYHHQLLFSKLMTKLHSFILSPLLRLYYN